MSKSMIKVLETFMLRRIIPKDIVIKYFKGEYIKRKLPKNKVKKNNHFVKLGKTIGSDNSSEIYRFVDKSNNVQTILTTNHGAYNFDQNLEIRCKYCHRNNMKNPVGIPINMSIDKNNHLEFVLIDPCCDFGCAFSHLKSLGGKDRFYKGPLYMNAEQMLNCLYYRLYPDKRGTSIMEKPDAYLLKNNGGPLTDVEFDSNGAKYYPIPNITILPAKKQFIKLNIN